MTIHHIRWIRWISIYFLPDNEEFPYHIADATFNAHGESVKGADTSTIYSNHTVKIELLKYFIIKVHVNTCKNLKLQRHPALLQLQLVYRDNLYNLQPQRYL